MKTINQTTLLSLGFACPLGEEKTGCRFTLFRKLTIDERLKIVNTMSHAELRKIYDTHLQCLALREAIQPKEQSLLYGGPPIATLLRAQVYEPCVPSGKS